MLALWRRGAHRRVRKTRRQYERAVLGVLIVPLLVRGRVLLKRSTLPAYLIRLECSSCWRQYAAWRQTAGICGHVWGLVKQRLKGG